MGKCIFKVTVITSGNTHWNPKRAQNMGSASAGRDVLSPGVSLENNGLASFSEDR